VSGIRGQSLSLERKLLKDQAAEVLRGWRSHERIRGGPRLTERDVSRTLGIGGAPVPDRGFADIATIWPERNQPLGLKHHQGVEDRCEIPEIRAALERLAVEWAAIHMNQGNRATVYAALHMAEEAVAGGDAEACARRAIAQHRTICDRLIAPAC
jgi:DNA-binding GntR family transcriptional regulator